jgi:hypothetical protein
LRNPVLGKCIAIGQFAYLAGCRIVLASAKPRAECLLNG